MLRPAQQKRKSAGTTLYKKEAFDQITHFVEMDIKGAQNPTVGQAVRYYQE